MRSNEKWKTGDPPDSDYYLVLRRDCFETRPIVAYWTGSEWYHPQLSLIRYNIMWYYIPEFKMYEYSNPICDSQKRLRYF